MIARTGRRFTLLDAMILIVALAVGFALTDEPRWRTRQFADFLTLGRTSGERARFLLVEALTRLRIAAYLITPTLLSLTFAALVLRLRSSRPSRVQLGRQPGTVACLTVAVSFAYILLRWIPSAVHGITFRGESTWGFRPFYWLQAWQTLGLSVAVAWLVLAVGRRWRPERSWIDRLGRAAGWMWVAIWALELLTLWAQLLA